MTSNDRLNSRALHQVKTISFIEELPFLPYLLCSKPVKPAHVMYKRLIFCTLSWPNMVKWCNSWIIKHIIFRTLLRRNIFQLAVTSTVPQSHSSPSSLKPLPQTAPPNNYEMPTINQTCYNTSTTAIARFSNECRKTNTNVINSTNHGRCKMGKELIQIRTNSM